MTRPRPHRHILHPELTLSQLLAALPTWVRPDPERAGWVEILREQLPRALAAKLLLPLVRVGSLDPDGRAVLPGAEWESLAEAFLNQAHVVLDRRDALLWVEKGPPQEEFAWAPHLEPWRVVDMGRFGPCLEGRVTALTPGGPETIGPTLLLGLGPERAWARLLRGWVRLGRREEDPQTGQAGRGLGVDASPRVLGESETETALGDLRRRTAEQVADLVPLPEDRLGFRFILGPLDNLPRPTPAGEDGPDRIGEGTAGPPEGGTSEVLTEAERLVVRAYRIFGDELPVWLLRRSLWLGSERPIDLLGDVPGHARLAEHLMALEAGVYL
ncbi:hypothetical protein Rumeso_03595 [Rubellimicrobium mesophilum DSM 19309]|uniref:Uncharacterized protein n=1 Tax=Rubellimicrobium mesophilum DSM 19309 TaxID=442562 RepID=A0A017HKX6_9RHOB|nr:hypothetical protein [Rubellimicrobium mesophilum]EYD74828.1 hypothetical protein Rumeso_03595 [Rubellimicrobium mesophilum DSM 19309]